MSTGTAFAVPHWNTIALSVGASADPVGRDPILIGGIFANPGTHPLLIMSACPSVADQYGIPTSSPSASDAVIVSLAMLDR